MKLGAHSKCSVIGKFVTLMVIGIVVPGSANPIWDFTKPTNNVAQAAVGGLALGAAGALALSYLKGSGGRSRSRGHYGGNYGWGRRKRDANPINKWQLEKSVHDYITRFDPSDCTRRLICDAATGRKETFALKNVLEVLPKDDDEIPQPLRKLANQLMTAKKYGELLKSVESCETTFKCPLSGFQFKQLMTPSDQYLHSNMILD